MVTESVGAEETIVGDLCCFRCGYNLRTMPASNVCPECGQPVGLSMRVDRARRGRWHVQAADGYAAWMRGLSHAMLVAVLAAVVGSVFPFNRRWIGVTDLIGAAVAWTLGCWALWLAGARPALHPAGRRGMAPLRSVMRVAAVTALAWPVVLELADRLAPWQHIAKHAYAAARGMVWLIGLGSVTFYLYVGLVGWQTFRRAMLPLGAMFAAIAAVVVAACAAEVEPFRLPAGAVGFTSNFVKHYLPVVGPVRGGALLLWPLSFLIWAAFAFAWTARCYELQSEPRQRDEPAGSAGGITSPAAAPGGRSAASSRP